MKTFCGPKCSLCCTLLSVWGIVQLGIMGVLFAIRSPAFIEDLSVPVEDVDPVTFLHAMNDSYYLMDDFHNNCESHCTAIWEGEGELSVRDLVSRFGLTAQVVCVNDLGF